MEASKVYYTDFRCPVGTSLLEKLRRVCIAAGIKDIDMDGRFVAIKMHFGELGNLAFLRPNYAKVVADLCKEQGGMPFLTDCNTLYPGSRKNALEHLSCAQLNGFWPMTTGCQVIIGDGLRGTDEVDEEFMTGREVSVLSFVDGKNIRIMTSSQDHKRAMDGDQGLNTGGMGTFSPSPFYTDEVDEFCKKYIYQKTVDAMAAEGREFKGVIFFGLMLTPKGPKVLEYNARFGDPETQVVLPRMKNDIVDIFEACVDGTLDQIDLEFEDNAAVCVVLASDGYPVKYEKGFPIHGLEHFKGCKDKFVFHAGSKLKDGQIVTNGGRVLGVTALGSTLKEARANAYKAVELVDFDNKYYRHDIGKAIDEV